MDNQEKCDACHKNPVKYKLEHIGKIKCPYCCYLKYEKLTLDLCSTKCPRLYWRCTGYLPKREDYHVKFAFMLEIGACDNCETRFSRSVLRRL
jgi:hypothetical protein